MENAKDQNLSIQLIVTEDGSHSLYLPHVNEPYHSVHGAIQESECVFIQNGLRYFNQSELSVFEVGFGTGLNAYLTYLACKQTKIRYRAIEAFPLDIQLLEQLNYHILLGAEFGEFMQLHQASWHQQVKLSENFLLEKIHARLEDHIFDETLYDLVYFDAFAPDVNPELWTHEQFAKVYNQMNTKGVLVTYCCKGIVKRALKEVGFIIEKLPGPVGKREVLRAVKL